MRQIYLVFLNQDLFARLNNPTNDILEQRLAALEGNCCSSDSIWNCCNRQRYWFY
jgi:O-acetylhomoserine/O-acetylserine sulfhydrylase-like pyridoxal-dependent enzyme